MNKQQGVIHLVLPLLLLLAIGAVIFVLVSLKVIKLPSISIPFLQQKVAVELKKEYKNPFKKETQYVNPFDTYKNPFAVK